MTIADATKLLTKCIKQAIIMMNEGRRQLYDNTNCRVCYQFSIIMNYCTFVIIVYLNNHDLISRQ